MRLPNLIVVAFLTFGSAGFAEAPAPGSASELYQWCRVSVRLDDGAKDISVKEGTEAFLCLGFVKGVSRTLGLLHVESLDEGLPKAFKSCVPSSATASELSRVIVKYLSDNPQDLHLTNTIVTLAAFGHAYPCS